MHSSRFSRTAGLAGRFIHAARRHWIALVALFFAVGGGGTVALAAGGSSSRTYYACVGARYGTLSLTSKTGTCGTGERKISFDARGERGLTGAAGRVGRTGADGTAGKRGAVGARGETGSAGLLGAIGAAGERGAAGADGLAGEDGAKGDSGATGPQGEAGKDGLDGLDGGTGASGNDGAAGKDGAKGETGPQGVTGPQGEAGAAGKDGAKGETGTAGNDGAKGETGAAGKDGAKGETGAAGRDGVGSIAATDANGVSLGRVLASSSTLVTILTSAGYQLSLPWSGKAAPAQIYYTGSCAAPGTAYLNASGQAIITGKQVVFAGSLNSFARPADVTDGVSPGSSMTSTSIDNPACGSSVGTRIGHRLETVTNEQVGLPATIAGPLTIG